MLGVFLYDILVIMGNRENVCHGKAKPFIGDDIRLGLAVHFLSETCNTARVYLGFSRSQVRGAYYDEVQILQQVRSRTIISRKSAWRLARVLSNSNLS